MKPSFSVRVVKFTILEELEGAWSSPNLAAVLDAAGVEDAGDIDDAELRQMCVLALQDLIPAEAAVIVLTQRIGDGLRPGQIRNLAEESQDEKLWEHYADMSLHERMFEAAGLLHEAFPGVFPQPDAVRVRVEIVARNSPAKEILAGPVHESFLVRLLAEGMEGGCALHRLFDAQLAGDSFPEADNIVWTAVAETSQPNAVTLDITSSGLWLDALRETQAYESAAYPDPPAS